MNWLHYLLEANVYLAIFYAFYCLFLNKETHYTLNRVYLLLSCVVAFILPLVQVSALKPAAESAQQSYISIVANNPNNKVPALVNYQPPVSHFTLQDAILYLYLTGIVVMALLLLIKIGKLIKMTTRGNTILTDKYKLIGIQSSNTAFSFFNYLFIGTKINGSDTIIRHELVHIKQKHSADIIFIEILRIINWFNPIIYFVQISLKTVHEYIADEETAAHETDAITYSSFLVDNAYGINGSSITHSFFNYNLLKKRIIMLNQKRSGNLARLKYLAALPVCAGMLCTSTLAFSKNYAFIDLAPKQNEPATVTSADVELKAKPQKNAQHLLPALPTVSVNAVTVSVAPMKVSDAAKLLQPPPPAPPVGIQADTTANEAIHTLVKYVAKYTRYPSVDHDNHIGGRVIATFDMVGGKITNPQISRSVEPVMDGELLRVLKAYDGSLNLAAGHYAMPVSFQLIDSKNNHVAHLPENYTNATQKPTAANAAKQSNSFSTSLMLDEVVIAGYTKD